MLENILDHNIKLSQKSKLKIKILFSQFKFLIMFILVFTLKKQLKLLVKQYTYARTYLIKALAMIKLVLN
jgi:hypothetical protein